MSFTINTQHEQRTSRNVKVATVAAWPSGKRVPTVKKLKQTDLGPMSSDESITWRTSYNTCGTLSGSTIEDNTFISCDTINPNSYVGLDHCTLQWVVKDRSGCPIYFDNQDEANEYSRNMMMAGITHYPKHLWTGEEIEYNPHQDPQWVTRYPSGKQYHKTLDHARAYIRETKNSIPPWERSGDDISAHTNRLLDKLKADKQYRLLDKNDIRKSKSYKSGSKWIVANVNTGKDVVVNTYQCALDYIDKQNAIIHSKARIAKAQADIINKRVEADIPGELNRYTGTINPKEKAEYYVKRDNGKWCIFSRKTKHFGYDTKVSIDPATGSLYADNYMHARRVCKEMNSSSAKEKAVDDILIHPDAM